MIRIGISTKMYMGYRQTLDWMSEVTAIATANQAVRAGQVSLFLAPSAAALESAVRITTGTPVQVCVQDVSRHPGGVDGAHTGDLGAGFLAELGVRMAEIGHAERRAAYGETDEVVAAKAAASRAAGLLPLLCVGEAERTDPQDAAKACAAQVQAVGSGPLTIAYEPIWAIGAPEPADPGYVTAVVGALRDLVDAPATVIYGGSAGPGLLGRLHPTVDGLFLGRFAHDPANVATVLAEAEQLTA